MTMSKLYGTCVLLLFQLMQEINCEDWHFQGQNVALRKSATQLPGTYQQKYTADLAVDGKTGSIPYITAGEYLCTHTDAEKVNQAASWTVDLGQSFIINGIRIFNRNDNAFRTDKAIQNRLRDFTVTGIPTASGAAELLYDDRTSHAKLYKEMIININVTSQTYFRLITVAIPARPTELVYLTLCEVQIYAVSGKPCPNLPDVPHAQYIQTRHPYYPGDSEWLRCDTGYLPQTDQQLTCTQSSTWQPPQPTCSLITCPHPGPLEHGYYTEQQLHVSQPYTSGPVVVGTTVTVSCLTGYTPSVSAITCTNSASWSTPQPSCSPIPCSHPGPLAHGSYTYPRGQRYTSGPVAVGKSVTASCSPGFKPSVSVIKCTQLSTWSTPLPICLPITCPYPGPLEHGYYTDKLGKNFTTGRVGFGKAVNVSCSTGYKPTVDVMQCTQYSSYGTWNSYAICKRITCQPIDDTIPNGGKYIYTYNNIATTSQTYVYGTSANATCPSNFRFVGEDKLRTCGASSTWTGTPGDCVAVCQAPQTDNGTYEALRIGVSEPYTVGQSVQLKCHDGFEINNTAPGSAETPRICLADHSWDGEPLMCTAIKQQSVAAADTSGKSSSLNNAAIGGGAVAGIALLVGMAVLVIVVMRKRKMTPKTSKHDRNHGYQKSSPGADEANVYNEIGDMEAGTEGGNSHVVSAVVPVGGDDSREYYSFTNPLKMPDRGIKLADLSDFVLSTSQDNDKYAAEFKSFPDGMVKPHNAALKNKDKNRYKNLYAYDETRVVLSVSNPKTETDYINANHVHGFNSPRAYIASQGATNENLNDFWRMIWQTNSGKIVMLTNVWEEFKVKCVEYWPVEEDTKTYGSITVTLANTEVFSNFVIRTLVVKKENERERHVQQFHFTAWPDRGVPKYSSALVHFRSKVKHAPTTCNGPTIVHCSAGIGRTGTYIALDYLTDQGKKLGMVDVAGCVESLRRQRVNMVQTKEQYAFIHHALVETLMLSTSALPAEKFPETYRDLLTVDLYKGKQKLDLEFQMLGSMSPAPEEKQYSTAKEVKHRENNRYSNILPLDDFMPSLHEPGHSSDEGGYINAAFLPSYKDANALIITQSPLETTVEDFWKMVRHQQVHTIVMMNSRAELKDNEVYWPATDEKVTFGDIEVTGKRSEKKVGHCVLTLTLKFLDMERKIQLFQFGHWASGAEVPEEPKHILTALELVQDWQRRTGNHTVVAHCMDGTERSGLFCVLYALLERTKIEHDVAIAQVIQEMRNRREQIIPNLAQFQFCHEVVSEFLKQFDTYSNFSSI